LYVNNLRYFCFLCFVFVVNESKCNNFFRYAAYFFQKKTSKRYYSDFEIVMRPTFDFSSHLLSRGIMLKVIEPQWLADEIYEMHMQAAEMYEER